MRMFSGGMPRASYGDRHTVSVIHGEKHVVFDFSSKVVDFFVVCDSDRRRRLSQSMGDIAGASVNLWGCDFSSDELIVGNSCVSNLLIVNEILLILRKLYYC